MARFYGWPPSVIDDLTVDEFDLYYKAIAPLEADEFLTDLKKQDWPNMKDTARMQLHSRMSDIAYNTIKSASKNKTKITNEQLAKILMKR